MNSDFLSSSLSTFLDPSGQTVALTKDTTLNGANIDYLAHYLYIIPEKSAAG